MAGKIERQINAPKVQTAKVETPAKTAAVAKVDAAVVDGNKFSAQRPAAIETGGGGKHIAGSAQPDALWGNSAPKALRPSLDPHQFDKLTPAQKTERLEQLTETRDALQNKILERVTQLDVKWNNASTATKEEALKHYAENSEQLDPQTRNEINQMLAQAAVAQRRIDRLESRRNGMPPSRNATPEEKARRNELAKELRAARKERKDAVKDATKIVDDKGLKTDRLAVTEQVIDPEAPKATESSSLLGMVKDFFKFDWMTRSLQAMIEQFKDYSSDKNVAERAKAREVATRVWVDKKIDEKAVLKELDAAADLMKHGTLKSGV